MKRAGRKSAEAKAALTLIDVSHFRPDPPEELTQEQQQISSDVVGSMKPGSFAPSTYPLLVQYCICVTRCRFIANQLRGIDIKKNFKEFKAWAAMERNETAVLCVLATKLRSCCPKQTPAPTGSKQPKIPRLGLSASVRGRMKATTKHPSPPLEGSITMLKWFRRPKSKQETKQIIPQDTIIQAHPGFFQIRFVAPSIGKITPQSIKEQATIFPVIGWDYFGRKAHTCHPR